MDVSHTFPHHRQDEREGIMIRLHHCHQTRSMRSLWLLHELGVDFDLQVYPFDKTLRSPEYKALNPAGRVPALELDGAVIIETGAITQVLCERFPEAGLGRAPEDPERAEWLIWVHFAETMSQHIATLTQQHVVLYEDHMRSPILMQLEPKRLANCFQAAEQRLQNRAHLLDSGFSAADISIGHAVYMGRYFTRLDPFPRLAEWYARVTARPGFQASLPPAGSKSLYARDFYEPWDT